MNIRSLSNPAQVLGKEKVESSKTIKSDETADREANGQQLHGEAEEHRELTEEETEEVLEKIKSHEGIVKNGLIVKLNVEMGQKIVTIEDPQGNVVKRFIERDLHSFLQQKKGDKFRLVNKSA